MASSDHPLSWRPIAALAFNNNITAITELGGFVFDGNGGWRWRRRGEVEWAAELQHDNGGTNIRNQRLQGHRPAMSVAWQMTSLRRRRHTTENNSSGSWDVSPTSIFVDSLEHPWRWMFWCFSLVNNGCFGFNRWVGGAGNCRKEDAASVGY